MENTGLRYVKASGLLALEIWGGQNCRMRLAVSCSYGFRRKLDMSAYAAN